MTYVNYLFINNFKSRKLMENHVIMRPQSFVWSKIGRSHPVSKKGKNRIDGPRTNIAPR